MEILAQVLIVTVLAGAEECQKQQATSQINQKTLDTKESGQSTVLDKKEEQKRIREILERIEKKYGSMKRFQAKIHKFEYDSVFNMETRGTGTLYFDETGNTRLDFYPLMKEFVSERKSANGKTYKGTSLMRETWIWRNNELIQFHHQKKSAYSYKPSGEGEKSFLTFILSSILSSRIQIFPLCFTNAPGKRNSRQTAKEYLKRFQISIESEDQTHIRLKLIPLWSHDLANYKMARIIVEKQTAFVTAQQMTDPTGNIETVYVYSDIQIDDEFPLFADRIYPELTQYRDYKIVNLLPDSWKTAKRTKQKQTKPKK